MGQRLAQCTALITGAASGIGYACALRFAAEGARVYGFDCGDCEAWEAVVEQAPGARLTRGDVTDAAALNDWVQTARDESGGVDILVTAAGVADAGPVHWVEESAWDRVIDVNLKGTFLAIKATVPALMAQGGGSIITIASVEGLQGSEGGSSYNASKGGVVLLSKNVAMDYGRLGIRCNAICPGFIDTPMFRQVMYAEGMDAYREDVRQQHKLGRFGRAEEIASVAFFLAGEDASFVTGQAIAVDGGYTAGHGHGLVELMGLV